eukprot:scaffold4675_cov378-Prasinococcus_capsulatus_cf.AAC.13
MDAPEQPPTPWPGARLARTQLGRLPPLPPVFERTPWHGPLYGASRDSGLGCGPPRATCVSRPPKRVTFAAHVPRTHSPSTSTTEVDLARS